MVIGRVYHHVVRLLFGLPVRDTDCDFRLIRRALLDQVELPSTQGVICVEMMRKFHGAGARFVEVGVSHHARPHGRSQFFRLPAIARSARSSWCSGGGCFCEPPRGRASATSTCPRRDVTVSRLNQAE